MPRRRASSAAYMVFKCRRAVLCFSSHSAVSIWRFRNKAYYTVWTVLFLAVCSVALSAYVVTFDAKFDFYMLPTRAFELLLGSSLAFVEHDGKRFFAPWCYLFGLAVVFFCIFGFGRVPKESFPGLWALLPCIGTALCIYGGTSAKETWAGRILSGRVMAGIGLISYSLYLYHWPFLVFFRQTSLEPVSGTWELLPVFGAVFALSCLSYFFVEQPIRKKRVLRTRRVLFTAAFACVLAFFLLGHFGRKYITPYVPDGAETYLLEEREWDFVKEHAFLFDGVPVARLGSESRPFSFLVLGDSHAAMLAHAVSEEASSMVCPDLSWREGGTKYLLPCLRMMNRAEKSWKKAHSNLSCFLSAGLSTWSSVILPSLMMSIRTLENTSAIFRKN